jgi:hypothetical protein
MRMTCHQNVRRALFLDEISVRDEVAGDAGSCKPGRDLDRVLREVWIPDGFASWHDSKARANRYQLDFATRKITHPAAISLVRGGVIDFPHRNPRSQLFVKRNHITTYADKHVLVALHQCPYSN